MRRFHWRQMLLALFPYLGILLLEVLRRFASWTFAPVLGWMAGLLVICGVNIDYALRRKAGTALQGMTVKLALIPFCAVTFFYGIVLFAVPPAVIILFLLDGLLLLAGSAYTLRGIYGLWQGGQVKGGWIIMLVLTQLVFVLDVPGSIMIYALEKRRSH